MSEPVGSPIRTDPVSLWGHVIEGFQATNRHLHGVIAREFALDAAEAEVLLRLSRSVRQRLPMSDLSGQVALRTGGVTKVADRLVRRGLAERVPCREDRRVTHLHLTAEGERVGGSLQRRVAEVVRAIYIEVLGPERAELVAVAMAELADARRG